MTKGRLLRFLGGRGKTDAGKLELYLISARALLQARAEAEGMAGQDEAARGLYLNACILAKAARKDGEFVFSSGAEVLEKLPTERIGQWMQRYLRLCGEENPSCCQENPEEWKDELAEEPYERLKWKVLRTFGVLPSETRAREMTDGDYLYCVMQMVLDEEEFLDSLCPDCRSEALKPKCPCCGGAVGEENPAFDQARFEELRRG